MTNRLRGAALLGAIAAIVGIIVAIEVLILPPDPTVASGPAPATSPSAIRPDAAAHQGPVAPDFTGIERWLNSRPLSLADLRGRVVLVDFWTYSCANCLNTLPWVRDWQTKYGPEGLLIVGVHTPEFEFERVEANVREAIARERVTWPVAMDNGYATWRAYRNRWWPHKFLLDADGVIRYHHIGEGAYLETEIQIRNLLAEIEVDVSGIPLGLGEIEPIESGVPPRTRELYAGRGFELGGFVGNAGPAGARPPAIFEDTGARVEGQLFLHGRWDWESEYARHAGASADFGDHASISYVASEVNIMAGAIDAAPVTVRVTLDGQPVPMALRGGDLMVDGDGHTVMTVDAFRLYSAIRGERRGMHDLRLSVAAPGLALYAFTFGA